MAKKKPVKKATKKTAAKPKAAAVQSSVKPVEKTEYFEGMSPPALPAIDKQMEKLENAKRALEAAKSAKESEEAALATLMLEHLDDVQTVKDGEYRYVSAKLHIALTVQVITTTKVKQKAAPENDD